MSIELFNNGIHQYLMFNDLVGEHDEAVQANQFLIISDKQAVLIDPCGNSTYNALTIELMKYTHKKELAFLFASHQDPDIIGSLDKWLYSTSCQLYVSELWSRFVPHFCNLNRADGRIVGIPDAGMIVRLKASKLHAIPAHFLHAEGNFQFYDSTSQILFSGDLGASLVDSASISTPISTRSEFEAHLPTMRGFHKRYMVSNKVCRYWANMAKTMPIKKIVPQHGRYFTGEAIPALLDWISNLECGIDLFTQQHYQFRPA